ncbi:hypothetical protein EDD16DRAFT_1477850 [Pisolithus croceorrhizus]|nr:hypothetical protein EV401DRAFT_1876843 [Pisolithus croceorrhizus]KAI6120998.1 hypothetical protein EDD16DRAFT_1477850 [Pisolithus croceorrhizus]KAI6152741.1 hypothetical protein EDD17DRAFT_1491032 [Pisolithus thermaeus]
MRPPSPICWKKPKAYVCAGIDAISECGYCIIQSSQIMHIPYLYGRQGCSFHCHQFIMMLQGHAKWVLGVDVVKATANELIECQHTKWAMVLQRAHQAGSRSGYLIIIANGCFSNFRYAVMGKASRESSTKSHFGDVIFKDTQLPIPQCGTVTLMQGHGPVLLYQILEHNTHMLVAE